MSEPTKMVGQASRFELALGAARDAIGSARDVERLRAQLQPKLLHEAGAATPARAALPPTAAVGVGKLALVGASLLALGALYLGWNRWPATTSAPAQASTRFVPAREARPARLLAERSSPEHDDSLVPDVLPRAPAPAPSTALPEKLKPRARSHTRATTPERTNDQQPTAAPASPTTEVALIAQAQSQLDRQPLAALNLLLEHERQFPHGILAEERDGLRVEAERALARMPQAIAHAQAFCAQYPHSPQTRRLEHWLAAQTNTAADHK